MTLPLQHVKVLDVSEHGFVPAAAAVLADWGADVVKVERLQGDAMRGIIGSGMVPSSDGFDFLFELANRNKRGIALDIQAVAGREIFEKLVAWADVYVTNQLPQVRRKLHTEPADLFAINPRLVYAKGSGQGQRGADAETGGFDAVSFWARGGVGHVLAAAEAPSPPTQRPAQGDVPSGAFLAGGICAALVSAQHTGIGVVVDTSLLGGALWTLSPDIAYASVADAQLPLAPEATRGPLKKTYRTEDARFVTLMMIDETRYWAQACRALGIDDVAESHLDPRRRAADNLMLTERVRTAIAGLTRDDLESRLRAERCIFAVFQDPPEVLRDDSVVANGYAMPHPTHPTLRISAAPAQFDDELPSIRRAAPVKGADTREVLREIGYDNEAISEFEAEQVVMSAGTREN